MNPSPVIGIMIPELFDHYQAKVWKGISSRIEELGLRQICFVGGAFGYNDNKHKFRNNLYKLISTNRIDMLLVFSGPLTVASGSEAILDFLKPFRTIPIVSIGIDMEGITSVTVDNESGMYDLVNHMITKHGCKHIGFIKGPDSNDEAVMRHHAYQNALKDNGIPYKSELVIPGEFHPADGLKAVENLIDNKPQTQDKIDCLVASDDSTVIYAMGELAKRNINCPNDLPVGGFDDIEISEYTTPALTTVNQPLFQVGSASVDAAYEMYKTRVNIKKIQIPTQLVIRNSCGCGLSNKNETKHCGGKLSLNQIYTQISGEQTAKDTLNALLLDAVYFAVTSNSYDKTATYLEEIVLASKEKGISVSVWNNMADSYFDRFYKADLGEEKIEEMKTVENHIRVLLYKLEAKVWAQNSLSQDDYFEELQRYDDNLLLCFKEKDLKNTLSMGLPYFDVDFCMIALFEKDKKRSQVFYCQGNPAIEGVHFPSVNLYPDAIAKDVCLLSFTVHPIMQEQVPIGFVITSMKKFNTKTVEFISEKVSGGLARINLVQKINDHSQELERVVEERTKQLQMANRQLQELSFKDQLSGLYNRRFLNSMIIPDTRRFQKTLMFKAKGTEKRLHKPDSYVIMVVDIDHFKKVNDTYGHKAGDLVIQQVSYILKSAIRENDYVIRFGGEEFLVILKNFNSEHLAEKAETMRKKIKTYEFEAGLDAPLKITCSIGCATFPFCFQHPEFLDFSETINIADKALYYAKENGRNKAVEAHLNLNLPITEQDIANAFENIPQAIKNGSITFTDFTLPL